MGRHAVLYAIHGQACHAHHMSWNVYAGLSTLECLRWNVYAGNDQIEEIVKIKKIQKVAKVEET